MHYLDFSGYTKKQVPSTSLLHKNLFFVVPKCHLQLGYSTSQNRHLIILSTIIYPSSGEQGRLNPRPPKEKLQTLTIQLTNLPPKVIWLVQVNETSWQFKFQSNSKGKIGSTFSITFRENRCLSCKLLQHFGCSSQPVTGFTHTNVQAELANSQLTHDILLALVLVSSLKY